MTRAIRTIIRAAAILGMAAWAAPASAADFDATATAFIDNLATDVAELTTTSGMSPAERDARIQELFDERVDVRTVARFTLGEHWKRASTAERDEFTAVFRGLMVNAVAANAGKFLASPMTIERVMPVKNASQPEAMVLSRIATPSGNAFPIAWRVRKGDTGPQVIDIVFDGISLIMTKRDEYKAVLRSNGGDVEALVAQLKSMGSGDAAIAAHQD